MIRTSVNVGFTPTLEADNCGSDFSKTFLFSISFVLKDKKKTPRRLRILIDNAYIKLIDLSPAPEVNRLSTLCSNKVNDYFNAQKAICLDVCDAS